MPDEPIHVAGPEATEVVVQIPAEEVTTKKSTPKKKGTKPPVGTKKTPAKKAAPVKKAVAKKATKKAPKAESNGLRGRTCQHAGKKIFKVAKENPRREGTNGYNSFKVIKDGMTYEQYIAKGGRLVDLNWDIEKGYVKVK